MRTLAVISLLAMAACSTAPALPAGISSADIALYSQAMTEAGCIVESDEQALPVEQITGFDEGKLTEITDYLVATGDVAITSDGIRLTTGRCANA